MTFIPIPDAAEAAIQFILDSIPSVMTLGFKNTGGVPFDSAALGDLATVIQSTLVTGLKAKQHTNVEYTNIHLRSLNAEEDAIFDLPLTDVGALTTEMLPNQVCMSVTFLTGIAGRSYRGRNFVGGLVVGDLENSIQWSSTILGAIQVVYENFDIALPAVDAEHVVLSRFHDKAARDPGVAVPVIGYRPNVGLTTQKRRLT